QVIYQHRTIVCAWTREVSSIRPICASPGQSVGAELLLAVLHQPCGSRTRQVGGVPVPADIPRQQRPDPCCRRSAPASDPALRGTEGSNPSPSSEESREQRAHHPSKVDLRPDTGAVAILASPDVRSRQRGAPRPNRLGSIP